MSRSHFMPSSYGSVDAISTITSHLSWTAMLLVSYFEFIENNFFVTPFSLHSVFGSKKIEGPCLTKMIDYRAHRG